MAALAVSIEHLTPERLPGVVAFMNGEAFSDNPLWRTCYCVFHYLSDARAGDWAERTGDENRALLADLVGNERGHWLVAYHEGRVVGWVNADLRPALRRYDQWRTPSEPDTGIIACFVVHPRLRRRGIATALLEAAVTSLHARGARRVDAYTVKDPEGQARDTPGLGPDQLAHHGWLAMYVASGFAPVGEDGPFVHLRRELSP